MKPRDILTATAMVPLFASVAFAGEGVLDSGDTAWVLVATALVMMMTPAGLALFYGGMSRSKNLLNTIAMTVVAYCLASVVWVVWGYAIAFGPDVYGLVGRLDHLFLRGIDHNSVTGTIPTLVFVIFQMTFACITAALVLGSVVDRMKFSAWILFTLVWITVVYAPVAHWVWGGGWMHAMGALDFAGGNVVHINAGVAGLVLSMVVGKRLGYGTEAMIPSSIALTSLGAALLWFGWFGFNAGSQLAADGIAGSAFLVTNTSAAAGGLGWMALEWYHSDRPTLLGIASGVIAGLVAITPGAGFVNLPCSLIMGLVSGCIGYFSVGFLKKRMGYDDSLDAFGVHGVCGIWGALATGLFADPSITPGAAGLFFGNPGQLWIQFVSVVATVAYSGVVTLAVIVPIGYVTSGLRVDKDDEITGLDSSIHGERAFELF
jgi:Amt family ammonium transporter